MKDNFNGDNAALVRSIDALLALDAEGALKPHGVGGHARTMLEAAAVRLTPSAPAVDALYARAVSNAAETACLDDGVEDHWAPEVLQGPHTNVAYTQDLYPRAERVEVVVISHSDYLRACNALLESRQDATSVASSATNECIVQKNCAWPTCRRECVIDSRTQACASSSDSTQTEPAETIYQTKLKRAQDWRDCDKETFDYYITHPHRVDTRIVYTAPPAASGQKLTLSPKARDALDSACSFFEIHGFDDYVSELRVLLRASDSATASDSQGGAA